MLNFVSEKGIGRKIKNIGFIGLPACHGSLVSELRQIPDIGFAGAFSLQECNESSFQITTNPFGLISQSDIIVASKTDKQSLNLIVESFLNSRHVILTHPFSLDTEEFCHLEKLCTEGRTHLIPYNSLRNLELIESLVISGRNAQHMEISLTTASIQDSMSLKQRIFELIYLLNTLSMASIKKILISHVPVFNHKTGCLKIWAEYENTCVATVLTDTSKKDESLIIKLFQKDQLIECDVLKNKIVKYTSENEPETISFTSQSTYIQYVFEKLSFPDSQDWFENQLNIYRKSLYQFHKLAFKFPFNKK